MLRDDCETSWKIREGLLRKRSRVMPISEVPMLDKFAGAKCGTIEGQVLSRCNESHGNILYFGLGAACTMIAILRLVTRTRTLGPTI
jgi:hypothetical protein